MAEVQIFVISIILFCGNLFAQGPAGLALSLDGDSDYVNFGNAIEANFDTSDFTIEFWLIKPSARSEAIFGKREICMHHSFWNSRMGGLASLEIDQDIIGTNHFGISSTNIVSDNIWHHIVFTRYDSTLKVYFDARLDTSRIGIGTTNISNTATLLIGENPCVGFDGTFNFSGRIDEVRIWNTVRTNAQIQNTWNDTLGSEYYSSADSGLIGYWRFDMLEDLGINGDGVDDVRDLSIYGNHGDLVGDATLDTSGALVAIIEEGIATLNGFNLIQNYPNPFNPTTTINYSLPQSAQVKLVVYDILGQKIVTLVNQFESAGEKSLKWNGKDESGQVVSSGVYVYRIEADNFVATHKMLLTQ